MKKALAIVMAVAMIFATAVAAGAAGANFTIQFVSDSGMLIETPVPVKAVVTTGGQVTFSKIYEAGAKSARPTVKIGDVITLTAEGYHFKGYSYTNDPAPSNPYTVAKIETAFKISYQIVLGELDSGNNGGGSGSGGGGGGGGSSTITSTLVNGNANTGLVTGNLSGSVSSATASKATTNAVAAAVKSAVASGANNADATVTLTNAGKITPAVFKSIVSAAEKASKGLNVDVTVSADTVKGKAVMGRLYMDLNEAARLTDAVNTSIDVNAASKVNAAITKKFNQYFSNDVAVVSFGQKGAFGMDVKAAVKVDTSKLDTTKLWFYSYDPATNAYTEITSPNNFVDTNGYMHFSTNMGNTVIITDAPLTSK